MRGLILTLIKLVVVFGVVLLMAHLVMNALGVNVDDLKDLLNESSSSLSVCYAAEKEPVAGEKTDSLCLFYDGEELFKVEAVPLGTAFSAPKIEKEGYTFNGWKYNGNVLVSSELTATDEIMFFYAEWELNIYTVSYYDINGNLIGSYEASIHSDVTSFQAPAIENREFLGWYNAADASDPLASDYKVTSDLVLIPQYSEVKGTFFLLVVPELVLSWEVPVIFKLLLLLVYLAVCIAFLYIIFKLWLKAMSFVSAEMYKLYLQCCYRLAKRRFSKDKPIPMWLQHNADVYVLLYMSFDADELTTECEG